MVRRVCFCSQEAESARVNLFELKAVTAAVESSGQRKAEAQVSRMSGLRETFSCRCVYLAAMISLSQISINLLVVYRESVNLIGYITRRLSADSQQL